MTYREVKVLVLTNTPERHNSQPTGFSGLREATMAPTVASITTSAFPTHQLGTGMPGCLRLRTTRSRLSAVNIAVIAHNAQANEVVARTLIYPSCDPAASTTETRARAAWS